jgi:hypothetical protein
VDETPISASLRVYFLANFSSVASVFYGLPSRAVDLALNGTAIHYAPCRQTAWSLRQVRNENKCSTSAFGQQWTFGTFLIFGGFSGDSVREQASALEYCVVSGVAGQSSNFRFTE